MNTHRGLLHHLNIMVSNLSRSSVFYESMFRHLGYELDSRGARSEHWKRWDLDTPHEIAIAQMDPELTSAKHVFGAVGFHHMAFCAQDRGDVDRFYADVLAPLEKQGLCTVEDRPCECPEHDEGYYATFFRDPDGLKYEFVFNPNYLRKKTERRLAPARASPPILEVAILDVKAGQEDAFEADFAAASVFIRAATGYISHELQRCVEKRGRYVLLVRWQSLESHTEGFRKSPQYGEWKKLLHHYYEPFPVVEHYSPVFQ
jgi:heme-degrading monooxygenase HmoA/catechol 2,3-dioxygenase-like lactoylglutathione lyase family enzyme